MQKSCSAFFEYMMLYEHNKVRIDFLGTQYGICAPRHAADFVDPVVCARRAQALQSCGILPPYTVHAQQMHGNTVYVASAGDVVPQSSAPCIQGDALATNDATVALYVKVSDCVPVFFFAPQAQGVAVAHAGWRGLLQNIIHRTHAALQQLVPAPSNIHAVIGPHAKACCFEIQDDTPGNAIRESFDPHGCIYARGKKTYADMTQYTRHMLMQSGIADANIHDRSACTVCHPEQFFSARRNDIANNIACIHIRT